MRFLFTIIPFLIFVSTQAYADPFVNDPNFLVEEYVTGLDRPTTMAFVGDDLLVLEKDTGNVRVIKNGVLQNEPVIHINVNNYWEYGLLGITTKDSTVYLYFSASEIHGGNPIANQIFKYTWNGETLQNGILVKELPVNKRGAHSAGAMETGLDGTIYAVKGMNGTQPQALQYVKERSFDERGKIIIVNKDESIIKPHLSENPFEHYYATGVRNSFGLAIDPKTGFLWDTENGEDANDEINLVNPKFNSGWPYVMGPASKNDVESIPDFNDFRYDDPKFTWEWTVAPTDLAFVNSKWFRDYENSLFVGTFNTGTIHKFELNQERTGFVFKDPSLSDHILNPGDATNEIVFASGFTTITDIEFGPDGFLYVVRIHDGSIFRIVPSFQLQENFKKPIPLWIKNNAFSWSNGNLINSDFLNGIGYMVNEKIIKKPDSVKFVETSHEKIPDWFKKNASWWSSGLITDYDYVSSLDFLIKKGILQITEFRTNCNVVPSIGVYLSDCDLSKQNLSNKNISNSIMKKVNLSEANLENTKMIQIDLSEANLKGSNLKMAALSGANLNKTNLKLANLEYSILTSAFLQNIDLSGSKLTNADLSGAEVRNADMSNIEALELRAVNSILTDTNLKNSNLSGSRFLNSVFDNSIFIHSDLSNVSLERAFLRNTNLDYANLTGAFLNKANFTNASLIEADLSDTDGNWSVFQNANLSGATMNNIDLRGVNLKGAILVDADLSNSKLVQANFQNANLTGANLSHADFTNAKFNGAILVDADLSNSTLTNVDFTGAKMDGCTGCPS